MTNPPDSPADRTHVHGTSESMSPGCRYEMRTAIAHTEEMFDAKLETCVERISSRLERHMRSLWYGNGDGPLVRLGSTLSKIESRIEDVEKSHRRLEERVTKHSCRMERPITQKLEPLKLDMMDRKLAYGGFIALGAGAMFLIIKVGWPVFIHVMQDIFALFGGP